MKITRIEYPSIVEWRNELGQLHREDGPAIVCAYGYKEWYINDKLHREDGPAIEYADGDKSWYINDKEYTEQDYNNYLLRKRLQKILEL